MSKKPDEVELAALQQERRDLLGRIIRMTEEYVNTTMPLHTRLRGVEDDLEAEGFL